VLFWRREIQCSERRVKEKKLQRLKPNLARALMAGLKPGPPKPPKAGSASDAREGYDRKFGEIGNE
jgi:hypothetical protein